MRASIDWRPPSIYNFIQTTLPKGTIIRLGEGAKVDSDPLSPKSFMLMVGRPLGSELIDKILDLYFEIDRQTMNLQAMAELRCPHGCGQCCESASPMTMVIEMLPAARELFSQGEAEYWLSTLASAKEGQRCVFYEPDPIIKGNGRCRFYAWRPAVCRLFGFATMKKKHGEVKLVTCDRQKKENPSILKAIEQAIPSGILLPSFDFFYFQMVTLDPSFGRARLPINQALRLALERYGLLVQCEDGSAREFGRHLFTGVALQKGDPLLSMGLGNEGLCEERAQISKGFT